MRLLVYPHDLDIGGSQINAIDLAAAVAQAGNDVVVYGIPGPLVDYIAERGLRFFPAHRMRYRPAPSRILELARLARRHRIDLIHAYEWPPCLDAYFGAGCLLRVPVLCTVLSMSVMPYVPASVPLIMGTAALADEARRRHRADVWVLEPPIDVARDHPGIDGSAFRRACAVTDEGLLIVTVSRLAVDIKLDALVRAIDAVDRLAARYAVKFVIVGDGPARAALACRAKAVNDRWGRPVITFAGAQLDPRPAYAAADVVVGMGSSALRGLAIGRPVVVQGEAAFSEVFEPGTVEIFLRQGFYGTADGCPGAGRLAGQLDGLLADRDRRVALGRFGRQLVCERFSLDRAARVQLRIYDRVLRDGWSPRVPDAIRSAGRALGLELANHDPRRQRERAARDERLLGAAHAGPWPPSALPVLRGAAGQ